VTEQHSVVNYLSDFKELQILCTPSLNCAHYCLLLLAKIGDGHIKIRPEYVGVIKIKRRFANTIKCIFFCQNCLKHRHTSYLFLFSFIVQYAMWKIQVNQPGLKLNGINQLQVSAHNDKLLCEKLSTVQENRGVSFVVGKEISS